MPACVIVCVHMRMLAVVQPKAAVICNSACGDTITLLGTLMRLVDSNYMQEDAQLKALVAEHGAKNWHLIAAGMRGRGSKSCRLRCVVFCYQNNRS